MNAEQPSPADLLRRVVVATRRGELDYTHVLDQLGLVGRVVTRNGTWHALDEFCMPLCRVRAPFSTVWADPCAGATRRCGNCTEILRGEGRSWW